MDASTRRQFLTTVGAGLGAAVVLPAIAGDGGQQSTNVKASLERWLNEKYKFRLRIAHWPHPGFMNQGEPIPEGHFYSVGTVKEPVVILGDKIEVDVITIDRMAMWENWNFRLGFCETNTNFEPESEEFKTIEELSRNEFGKHICFTGHRLRLIIRGGKADGTRVQWYMVDDQEKYLNRAAIKHIEQSLPFERVILVTDPGFSVARNPRPPKHFAGRMYLSQKA